MSDPVWVLVDEGEVGREFDGEGTGLVGVFSTPERALAYLSEEVTTEAIEWEVSPHNDGARTGWCEETERVYHLTRTEIDKGVA